MSFKIVLILAIIAQVLAAGLALRLNHRYKWYSAWVLISGAATVMAILQVSVLLTIWSWTSEAEVEQPDIYELWTICVCALLVSVLFVGGVSLIEPLFNEIVQAEELIKKEKQLLESEFNQTKEELRIAREIQQRLLPASAPDIPGFDLAGASLPAEWTSGDYFDFIPMRDDRFAVVVADVSGHGTGPALLSTATRAYLRALTKSYGDVGEILTMANRSLADDVDQGRFVTAFLARLDPKTRTLVYASAGQDGILLTGDGKTKALDAAGLPLGAIADTTHDTAPEIQLAAGDILLLTSDGIAETEAESGEQFGLERIIDVVRKEHDRSAREIVDVLLNSARDFANGSPQRDDITAVVAKVVG